MSSKQDRSKHKTRRDTQVGQDLAQSDWTRVVKNLYADLHSRAADSPELTHDQVAELIPAYLAAEHAGEDVRTGFPALYKHLETCAQCHTLYDHIKTSMSEAGPWHQPADTIRIKNERPLSKSSLWEIVYPAKSGKRSTEIKIKFQSFPIQKRAIQVAVTRGGNDVPETLLLSDQITLDNQPILVQAWLAPDTKQENRVTMRVTMHGPAALTRNASAAIVWGQHRYASIFKKGQADLKHIDASDLDAPLSLTFDFSTHERPHRDSPTRTKTRPPKHAAAKRVSSPRKPRA